MLIVHPQRTLIRRALTLVLLLSLALSVSTVLAATDRKPPTTPTNLRVTGVTAYSVSFAWDPSTDDSGSVIYTICCANVNSETFPGPASTHVYRKGLQPGSTYTMRMFARDAAGNASGYSNTVTFTLPRDVTRPGKPVISLTDNGPTHVSLAWSATDDATFLWYTVYRNGSPYFQTTRNTSGTVLLLKPETGYTFTVTARDFGGNVSPLSDPLVVTTEPSDPNDHTPPTTPTGLYEIHWGDNEMEVNWTQSTDNVTEQRFIQYNVYVDGVLQDITVGSSRSIVYAPGTSNIVHISVEAIDEAGNVSAPASIIADLHQP